MKKTEEVEDENHRESDNKNEIYELRLVIYLCANLLLQKKGRRVREKWLGGGGGCDNIMSLENGNFL